VTLGDLLADLLDGAAGVEVPADREYARDGIAFAARTGEEVIELRLGRDIAAAARRTPDTGGSERGDDWVRFAPREWDPYAVDRLNAWFRVAWRSARSRPRQSR
jgi:hypothetical protein